MENINWIHTAVALLGGGAAGAIINNIITLFKSRVQPIGSRINILPVFIQSSDSPNLKAKIAIHHQKTLTTFENLHLVEIQIVNRGNSDMNEFGFGITLGATDQCIHVESSPPDRHHQAIQQTTINPQEPKSEIDYTLKPFNRKDLYQFKMYIVIPEGEKELKPINLGSPSPVKFVSLPTVGELVLKAAIESTLKVGPLDIRIK